MALVLLPCDLPTWPTVQRHLNQLKQARTANELIDGMLKLHNLCCVGLDPDEDAPNSSRFDGLRYFVEELLTEAERNRFFDTVLPCIVNSALKLKLLKPLNGVHYSLQQQADQVTFDRRFAMSLIANAFFSTYPKRTVKTHPTLQDFNFSDFFIHLDSEDQQLKLRCLLQYFDLAATQEPQGCITIARQITPEWSKQSLDDWLNCTNLLCPIIIRHEGTIEDAEEGTYQVCFASPKIGGDALADGNHQEELMFFKNPELLIMMLYIESLDNNETLSAHNWMCVGHLNETNRINRTMKSKDYCDTHLCAIDALNYAMNPVRQYEYKFLLRELSKAFLGFQQRKSLTRLSPIGESCGSTPPERLPSVNDLNDILHEPVVYTHARVTSQKVDIIKPHKPTSEILKNDKLPTRDLKPVSDRPTTVGSSSVNSQDATVLKMQSSVQADDPPKKGVDSATLSEKLSLLTLPTVMKQQQRKNKSQNSEEQYFNALSNQSSFSSAVEDELWFTPMEPPLSPSTSCLRPLFFSAENPRLESVSVHQHRTIKGNRAANSKSDEHELSDDEDYQSCVEEMDDEDTKQSKQLGPDLISSRGRYLFAESVRGAIQNTSQQSDVEDPNYSMDIQIEGPDVRDPEKICIRRVPSTGFLLDEDEFFGESLEAEQTWLRQFRNRSTSRSISRRNSSRYSFSSDFSSDLGDIYEHFEDMMASEPISHDPATAQYVGGLLKRTLSDSYTATVSRRSTITGSDAFMPRSLSLADHLTQERLALEKAKQQALSATSPTLKGSASENGGVKTPDALVQSRKLSGQLVSIVVDQCLDEVQTKVALSLPKQESEHVIAKLDKLHTLFYQLEGLKHDVDLSVDDTNSPQFGSDSFPVRSSHFPVERVHDCSKFRKHRRGAHDTNDDVFVPCDAVDGEDNLRSAASGIISQDDNVLGGFDTVSESPIKKVPTLRKWLSSSDSDLSQSLESNTTADFHELRKWDAIGDLFDNKQSSCPSIAPETERPPVTKRRCIGSLESLECAKPNIDSELYDSDPDQFWIILDNDQESHLASVDDCFPMRGNSFSGTKNAALGTLQRANSDPFQTLRVDVKHERFGVPDYVQETSMAGSYGFGTFLGQPCEIFPTLQAIEEKREADESALSSNENNAADDLSDQSAERRGATFGDASVRKTDEKPVDVASEVATTDTLRSFPDIQLYPDGYRAIATGNWGCGRLGGDAQLKAIIQWLAASRCGIPCLIYFTAGNNHVVKLNTIGRILVDRQWTVGTLTKTVFDYCRAVTESGRDASSPTLFDRILVKEVN